MITGCLAGVRPPLLLDGLGQRPRSLTAAPRGLSFRDFPPSSLSTPYPQSARSDFVVSPDYIPPKTTNKKYTNYRHCVSPPIATHHR